MGAGDGGLLRGGVGAAVGAGWGAGVGIARIFGGFAPAGAGASERAAGGGVAGAAGRVADEGGEAGGRAGGGGGQHLADAFLAELEVDFAGIFRAPVRPLVPARLAQQAIAELDAITAAQAQVFGPGEAFAAGFGGLAGRALAPGIIAGAEAADGDERNEQVPQAHGDLPLCCARGGDRGKCLIGG